MKLQHLWIIAASPFFSPLAFAAKVLFDFFASNTEILHCGFSPVYLNNQGDKSFPGNDVANDSGDDGQMNDVSYDVAHKANDD